MHVLLILALLFAAGIAQAAPTAHCTLRCAERVSGTCTVPAYVNVDCIGDGTTETTDNSVGGHVRPYHDLRWKIDYGDSACSSGQGTWPFGTPGISKNVDYDSPIGAHVYECAGTFTVTTTACDSAGVCDGTSTEDQITIEAENTGWSAANTRCQSNDGSAPVAGVGGCPAGVTDLADSPDYDAGLLTGAGKRTLFQCGDTFSASTNPTLTNALANGSLVSGYGSCSGNPASVTIDFAGALHEGTGTISGWRVRDMKYIGDSLDINNAWSSYSTLASNGLLLRVETTHMGHCPQYGVLSNSATTSELSAIVSSSCQADGCTSTFHWPWNEGSYKWGAFMGNHYDMDGIAANGFRGMGQEWTIFSHNKWTSSSVNGTTTASIQFRSSSNASTRDQQYLVWTDNEIYDNSDEVGRTLIFVSSGNLGLNGDHTRNHDYIIQRTRMGYGPDAGPRHVNFGIYVDGLMRATVRNNLIDFRGVDRDTAGFTCYAITSNTDDSDTIEMYNNTCINDQSGANTMTLCSGSATPNSICRNNLMWNVTDTTGNTAAGGTWTIESNNLAWNNTTNGCPFFGQADNCTLSAAGPSFDFAELKLRSSPPAGVKNSGFTFPDTSTAGQRPYVYLDAFLGCRGSATGGPDNTWDIGAHEYGADAASCLLGSISTSPILRGGVYRGATIR